MKATERAWAAGFFDGEGTVYCWSNGRQMPVVRAAVAQAGPAGRRVLCRFRQAVGVGTIYGPYQQNNGQTPYYRLDFNLAATTHLRKILWPYLSGPKKKQFIAAETKRRKICSSI